MTVVIISALALLCGVSVGIIIGILAGYIAFVRETNDSGDPDYSGGL